MTDTQPPLSTAALSLLTCVCLAFAGFACSGSSALVTEGSPLAEGIDLDTQFVPVEGGPGHINLYGPVDQLRPDDLVELVPRGPWPGGDDTRPAQALLLVTTVQDDAAAAIVVGQRHRMRPLEDLFGREVDRPSLALSKSVTSVLSRDGAELRLAAGAQAGVAEGDLFIVLGEPIGDRDRLGSRIAALVQVVNTAGGGARAEVIHQMAPFGAGSLALFTQHASLEGERPEAVIVFSRTDPNAPINSFALPALASAVFDYQVEFQFSNIRIETLDAFIDPAPYDAAEQAREAAPDTGFGVIVFGRDVGHEFLYNLTTYGTSPSLATTVGILPGGLPLSSPEGIEALSTQLAPSFLATAMTQRGDHAEVIYFLEHCLREGRITDDVAFHAREHLALRYESIGRLREGRLLMTRDIQEARDHGNPYAQLNALSIREFLNRQDGSFEDELTDLDTFLAVADDVLPDESLLAERIERSRILGRLDRYDEAVEELDGVSHQAQRQNSLRYEVSAALARANLLYQSGAVNEAIEAVQDTLTDARLVGDSYPRYSHALLARYFAEQNNQEAAMDNLQEALEYAAADGSPYARASTFELAATLHHQFNRTLEAVGNMREAAELYEELEQFEDVARALIQVGMLELRAIEATSDPRFIRIAYEHLAEAAEIYLALGDGSAAAEAFGLMGMINNSLGNYSQALANFAGTIELGQAYADPGMVALAYQRVAEIHLHQADISQAQLALQNARLWATTFELDQLLERLSEMEALMQNSI